MNSRPQWRTIAIVAIVVLLALIAGRWFGGDSSVLDAPSVTSPGTVPDTVPDGGAEPVPVSVLACAPAFDDGTVALDELPEEALTVLDEIADGGPFEFDQDGRTFQNRERHLPRRDAGYYEEYTVPTPGESDRGARRIVTGECGERYYTDDHYASFRSVVER